VHPEAPSAEGPGGPLDALFVVGSSRSGTTLMGRILGRHSRVHTFNELHFFEQLCAAEDLRVAIDRAAAVDLFARLLAIAREGYLGRGDPRRFAEEAEEALGTAPLAPLEVYRRFLTYETTLRGAEVPCEQTPRNVFFLEAIRSAFPRVKVVHMVRDPRDVVLSQKNKWKRRFLGAGNIPLREAVRAWVNYHPVVVARLWRGSVRAAGLPDAGSWVLHVRFEDLLSDPEATVRRVCRFAGLDFRPAMLAVPRIGSSTEPDRPDQSGIDAGRSGRWRVGLSPAELWLCQKTAGPVAAEQGYEPEAVRLPPVGVALSLAVLPVKLVAALVANLGRFRGLRAAIARRLRA